MCRYVTRSNPHSILVSAQVIFRPDDYRALMSILDSLKEMSAVTDEELEHVAEEKSVEIKEEPEITEDQTSMRSAGSCRFTYWFLFYSFFSYLCESYCFISGSRTKTRQR